MNESLYDASKKILIKDEGYREKPYKDTKGNYTIGVGFLIGRTINDLKLSRKTIEFMLQEQIEICISELVEIFGIDDFHCWQLPRQVALVSMIYNLGKPNFLGFRKMIQAIKLGQWLAASNECLKSQWADDVDPKQLAGIGRDDRIAFMLREGKFHDYYQVLP